MGNARVIRESFRNYNSLEGKQKLQLQSTTNRWIE